eukprot:evm.model.scf_92.1 EVM.evm.TU.scf_92.1   scf_92:15567-24845(-)
MLRATATLLPTSVLLFFVGISYGELEMSAGGWATVPKYRFPAVVTIRIRGQGTFGGVLINDCFVLTSAQLLDSHDRPPVTVLVHDIEKGGTRLEFGVDDVYIHPSWTGNFREGYDVALIRLNRPAASPVAILAEPPSHLLPNSKVFVLRSGEDIQLAEFHVVPSGFYPDLGQLEPHMLCAISHHANLSPGDLGGPVILPHIRSGEMAQNLGSNNLSEILQGTPEMDIVVGVLSHANFSLVHPGASIFTSVSSIEKWIDNVTSSDLDKNRDRNIKFWSVKGSSRCSGKPYHRTSKIPQSKRGWIRAPRGRLKAFVSVRGRGRDHACGGVMIGKRHVLTSANCINVVGPNPIVIIGVQGIDDDRRVEGVQEHRAEMAHIHPMWNGNVEEGYDAALLRLSRNADAPLTNLPNQKYDLQPESMVWGFKLGPALEMAQFRVVANEECPRMSSLGAGMFCAYSESAFMEPGSSGSPLLIAKTDDVKQWDANKDLLVGIVSCANYSSLQNSGVGCVLISSIESWIQQVVSPQAPFLDWSQILDTIHEHITSLPVVENLRLLTQNWLQAYAEVLQPYIVQ